MAGVAARQQRMDFATWYAMYGYYREPQYTPISIPDRRRRLHEDLERKRMEIEDRKRRFEEHRARLYGE